MSEAKAPRAWGCRGGRPRGTGKGRRVRVAAADIPPHDFPAGPPGRPRAPRAALRAGGQLRAAARGEAAGWVPSLSCLPQRVSRKRGVEPARLPDSRPGAESCCPAAAKAASTPAINARGLPSAQRSARARRTPCPPLGRTGSWAPFLPPLVDRSLGRPACLRLGATVAAPTPTRAVRRPGRCQAPGTPPADPSAASGSQAQPAGPPTRGWTSQLLQRSAGPAPPLLFKKGVQWIFLGRNSRKKPRQGLSQTQGCPPPCASPLHRLGVRGLGERRPPDLSAHQPPAPDLGGWGWGERDGGRGERPGGRQGD